MADLVFLALVIGFFAIATAYIRACAAVAKIDDGALVAQSAATSEDNGSTDFGSADLGSAAGRAAGRAVGRAVDGAQVGPIDAAAAPR